MLLGWVFTGAAAVGLGRIDCGKRKRKARVFVNAGALRRSDGIGTWVTSANPPRRGKLLFSGLRRALAGHANIDVGFGRFRRRPTAWMQISASFAFIR